MTFSKATLTFLRALKRNNDSEWFRENREAYVERVQAPSLAFAEGVLEACARKGLPFRGEAKKCLFRLNRDIRFSKDKSPFKTHLGIVFSPTGEKSSFGLGYVHVEPGSLFVAGGFWQPEPPELKRFRMALAREGKAFLAAVKSVEKAGFSMGLEDAAPLKRIPQGFGAYEDDPVGEYLRWKSFSASHPLTEEELFSDKAPALVAARLGKLLPLLEFGWTHVAPPRRPTGRGG